MELSLIRLLVDFGLVILIWMVQVLIYPSFLFFKKEDLFKWHKKYTQGMFYVVMPLMLGQLVIAGLQLFQVFSIFTMVYAITVFVLWLITFVWFVPLHRKITDGESTPEILKKLVSRNWWRTAIWSLLFVFSVVNFINN